MVHQLLAPREISETSRTARRFIRPAVIKNVFPYPKPALTGSPPPSRPNGRFESRPPRPLSQINRTRYRKPFPAQAIVESHENGLSARGTPTSPSRRTPVTKPAAMTPKKTAARTFFPKRRCPSPGTNHETPKRAGATDCTDLSLDSSGFFWLFLITASCAFRFETR